MTVSPSHVLATWMQCKDGSAMILIGNLGDTCTADITLPKIGRTNKVKPLEYRRQFQSAGYIKK